MRTAIVPDPDLQDRGFGRVHHHIPLRHHECRDDRQDNEPESTAQPPLGAAEQGFRQDPREVSHAEPERTDNGGNSADMRQVRLDLEMVAAEEPTRGDADVFHPEGDDNADRHQRERTPPAISQDGVGTGGENSNRCQNFRERGSIPGKTDHQGEVDRQHGPESRLAQRKEAAALRTLRPRYSLAHLFNAPYTSVFSPIRIRSLCGGDCIMQIANISSFGSMKKKAPPAPPHRYSPVGHDGVFAGTDVRTAKPRPKPLFSPGK